MKSIKDEFDRIDKKHDTFFKDALKRYAFILFGVIVLSVGGLAFLIWLVKVLFFGDSS